MKHALRKLVASFLAGVREIATAALSAGEGRSGRRKRAARRSRRGPLAFEHLEFRELFSAGPATVSSDWFHMAPQTRSGSTAANIANDWLVDLTPKALAANSSYAQAARRLASDGLTVKGGLGMAGWMEVATPASCATPAAQASFLAGIADLQTYEANQQYHLASVANSVNDPLASQLWGLDQIDTQDAWKATTGSRSVVVAVIDTGIDWSQPDLQANLWTNPGINDGFANDIHGWNFYSDTNNSNDDNGHGTHVAGTIGAVGNNGIGVVGVDQQVSLLPVKYLNSAGVGTSADATSFRVKGLKANTKYLFRVCAVNSAGWSAWSNTLSLQTTRT